MLSGLVGCSNLTPNQQYRHSAAIYNGASLGIFAADVAGKLPAEAKADVVKYQDAARDRLLEARAWLVANPALADVPGVVPPSLDLTKAAVDVLRRYVRRYLIGLPPLVPMDVPGQVEAE
jgi:hypothetical protein